MIKVSIFYPFGGARFDHDYYRTSHLPLVASLLGDACLRYAIDKGMSGGAPGSDPVYVAMCHIYSPDLDAFQAAFAPHADTIRADIANYTDVEPVMLVSEVIKP